MPLSITKIRELEILALQLRIDPDTLLNALISLGFEEPKKGRVENIQKLTPEQKVKTIEEEALNKGWTYEQLWKRPKFKNYSGMGLICFVDDHVTIGEVTEKYIVLLHERPVGGPIINNFYNMNVGQPWIKKITGEGGDTHNLSYELSKI